jgi:trimeric autotransporter adhesin
MKTTTLPIKNSMNYSPLRRAFIFVPLVSMCFALSPRLRAVTPAPDGGYLGANTAEGGAGTLFSLTTGTNNTAVGSQALFSLTTGQQNTAVGAQALRNNRANNNTADGFQALALTTTGFENAATGWRALVSNTIGFHNTADGFSALSGNTTGNHNTANGDEALGSNTTGNFNTTDGAHSLENNTTGTGNTALGFGAGDNVTTANNVICIGAGINGANVSNSCFIGSVFGQISSGGTAVFINSGGKLGTITSSRRFKEEIRPMAQASEVLFALKPVVFHYKKEIEPQKIPQFGLVAEDVEAVNPDLVVRDKEGKVNTVRYDAINAMLLNEFLKAHHEMEEQGATIARQQKQIEALTAGLQNVSAQLEMSKSAPRIVDNNQ